MSLIYLYITIFTIGFVALAVTSMRSEKKVRDKYTPKDANLCVVVYATGITNTLENLIKQLENQNYSKSNYTIYAILDKCENVSEVTLQSDLNVNVININNLEPIGKSQAFSIIAEKLKDVRNLDAYVFLDSKNYVENDFLLNINYYLTRHDVFNPQVVYLPQETQLSFIQNIKYVYSKYCAKFILHTKTRLGLTNILNTDSFVIRKDLLNKIADFDFRDLISEVKYTLKLAQEGYSVASLSDICIYKSIDNFDYRIPSLSGRLSVFWNEFFQAKNHKSREFLLSLVAPNWLVYVLCYYILLKHSYRFPFWISYTTILMTSLLLIVSFAVSVVNTKLSFKEFMYLILYPIDSLKRMFYNFPPVRGVRRLIQATTRKHVVEKMTANAFVTDGKVDYPCQLELISDDGLARVTFINRGKKYTTKNNHLRMVDAMREITSKLSDYGMSLKVCQCCKYFQPLVDGSTNMVRGCCNCQFQGRTPGDTIPTLLWNTCPKFEKENIVKLF